MWRCLSLCIVLTLCRDARGHIADQMAEVIQQCCDYGSGYARNQTAEECNIPSAPADVPAQFGSLCVMAQAQCCRDYFKKKEDCNGGIDIALTTGQCTRTKDATKVCCDECSRGSTAGLAGGTAACISRAHGATAEELLADDAYLKCCMKSAQEGPPTFTPKPTTLASQCEDFAPNELCAHHCIPIPGSYKCECNSGFMLMADGRNCREVVKNRCKPRNPCQHKCNDNGVDVLCSCRRGYELMPDGKSCQDINECQLNIPVCLPGTTCSNIHGSYRCIQQKPRPVVDTARGQCPPGFARNLKNNACDDINECKLPRPPCPSPHCVNTVGGYKCDGVTGDPINLAAAREVDDRCPPGFAMSDRGECEDSDLVDARAEDDRCPPGFTLGVVEDCEDVDDCAILKDDCNRLSQFCVNTHGSFFCQDMGSKHCRPGFKIDPVTSRCEDINECEEDPEVCRADQICVNQLGQYDCKLRPSATRPTNGRCPDGMRMNRDTRSCDDIDECVEGTHLCDQHQRCLNTNGSFECHCKLGYELDATTGACVDMNECATQQHNCLSTSQRCDNTVGSYICVRITSCGTGYILQHASGNCEDVDECALGTHNCAIAGPEYQCMNIPGSFRCVRKRAASTTTTPAPEYEYEYYDSDEEIDNQTSTNKTETQPPANVPSSSQAPNPPPTTTEVVPIPKMNIPDEREKERIPEERRSDEKIPEERQPEERSPEERRPEEGLPEERRPEENEPQRKPEDNNIIPPTPDDRDYSDRKPIDHIPEVPKYSPLYTTDTPKPTEPVTDITYKEPESANRPEIVYEPNSEPPTRKETPDFTYYDTRPEKPVSSNEIPAERLEPTERDSEVQRPYGPKATYSPYAPRSQTPRSQTPHTVLVNAGQETATVTGVKADDGSVLVDTKDVPKNEWTKINAKPRDCPPGFEPSDNGGCFDIDECITSRHSCSGITEICRNTIGGYLCDCAQGFRRDLVTGACDLIATSTSTSTTTSTTTELPPTFPPTLPPTTTPEPAPSTSQRELIFGYPDERPLSTRPFRPRNACDAGFHLNVHTGICEDIDECTNGQANCAAVEICVNTRGGYRCECPPNWRLDQGRHRCVPARGQGFPPGYGNEPAFPPADPQESIGHGSQGNNFVDPEITEIENRGTVLKCPWGYRLGDDNNCVDVNECATGEARCGVQQICTNLAGGYTCSCPRGHRLVGDHECRDVDECALAGNTSICSRHAECVNTPGSYQCKCHDGFRSAPVNDKVCLDVDECSESRAGSLCQHRCSNVWGSYRCSCHRGYRLNADNRTCGDVDECVQFKSKFPCVGKCLNEPGSYRCACPIGYRLSEDKRSCIDIDECETGEASCQTGMYGGTSQVCFNTRGSYHCHRISCPKGYELESKQYVDIADIDECQTGEASCQTGMYGGTSQVCFNTRGSYHCHRISCPKGYELESKQYVDIADIDECETGEASCQTGMYGGTSQVCFNTRGSYHCHRISCPKGYELESKQYVDIADIDECETGEASCQTGMYGGTSQVCFNTRGSYHCHRISCPKGYELESKQYVDIADIDECQTGEASCQTGMYGGTSQVCFNTRGSYHCHRISCPKGYELESKHRCTKAERVCQPGDWECAHQPTTISYNFITFVSKLYVPDGNVKLFTMRGPAWPYTELNFLLRLVNVNAPPHVKEPADIKAFLLIQSGHEAVISLVHPLEGPQSIELELSMELHNKQQFGGIAIAKVFIYVSEYEF